MSRSFRHSFTLRVEKILCASALCLLLPLPLSAQTVVQNTLPKPEEGKLFREDVKTVRTAEKKQIKSILSADAALSNQVDFKAPEVEFKKEENTVYGKGGVVVSGMGVQIEADKGSLNLTNNQSTVEGHVLITDQQGSIAADSATYNVEEETGVFNNARFSLEAEGYRVQTERADKLSETKYKLFNSLFTTCDCPRGEVPWQIETRECRITQEGYAHAYGVKLDLFDLPLFYSPWFGFPAKTERASGLLAPSIGYSNRHGFMARVPVFMALDDSSDVTVEPFIESQTRNGSFFDYRQVFSKYNQVLSRVIYSNERPRDGDLQGTVPESVYDPTIDDDRLGVLYNQRWTTAPDAPARVSFLADIHYVSDDLLLREIDDNRIGDRQLPFTVSRAVARAALGEYVNAEIGGEYDQSFTSDQDQVAQRLPEGQLEGLKTFYPFGANPYGLKLVTRANAGATNFAREKGYDGWRTNLSPTVSIPFHLQNYFYTIGQVRSDSTQYNLDDRVDPISGAILDDSESRQITRASYTVMTALERVYQLEGGNWLTSLTSFGSENQSNLLRRVKHVAEPFVNYTYAPDVNQDNLPFFDSFDRIAPRRVVTFGFNNTLIGRFTPRRGTDDEVLELMPRVEELPALGSSRALDDLSTLDEAQAFGGLDARRGQVRELLTFSLRESYDANIKESDDTLTTASRPWSDIGALLGLYPTRNFGLYVESTYSPYDTRLTSWDLTTAFHDDRGDALRFRYLYTFRSVSQPEANLEIVLTNRLKAGWYTRYDNIKHEFIENYAALRLTSACNCWHFDIGVRDTVNPEKTMFMVTFGLGGLGDLKQGVWTSRPSATP